MEQSYIIAGTPEVRIAVRVRGLSHEPLYFDEDTSTIRVTKEFIVIRLRIRLTSTSICT
jgi:phage repressor protein C with HTH and peptisase S24 domain